MRRLKDAQRWGLVEGRCGISFRFPCSFCFPYLQFGTMASACHRDPALGHFVGYYPTPDRTNLWDFASFPFGRSEERMAVIADRECCGGDQSPGLGRAQDLARCYAQIFPDHAERELAQEGLSSPSEDPRTGMCWFQFIPPRTMETSQTAS